MVPPPMERLPTFTEFERLAVDVYDAVPEEYRRGIDALILEEEARTHPAIDDYFTLGECVHRLDLPEAPLFSTIVLYYGSFVAVAERDRGFDVAEEVEETILHELRHHFEDRAGVDDLADDDAVEEQNERRRRGLPFDPTFFRYGEPVEPGVTEVSGDMFVEVTLSRRDLERRGRRLTVRFGGEPIEVDVPALEAPVTFVEIEGGWEDDSGAGGDLFVAVVARDRRPGQSPMR